MASLSALQGAYRRANGLAPPMQTRIYRYATASRSISARLRSTPNGSRRAIRHCDHTVARDRDSQRIGPDGRPDGAHCLRCTDAMCDLRITHRLARRDFAQRLPYALLERSATHIERQVESQGRGFDKAHHLGDHLLELGIASDQMRAREPILQIARQRIRIVADQNRAHATLARRDQDRAERALADRKAYFGVRTARTIGGRVIPKTSFDCS